MRRLIQGAQLETANSEICGYGAGDFAAIPRIRLRDMDDALGRAAGRAASGAEDCVRGAGFQFCTRDTSGAPLFQRSGALRLPLGEHLAGHL